MRKILTAMIITLFKTKRKRYLDSANDRCGEVYKSKTIVICWFTVLYYSNENALRRKQGFQNFGCITLTAQITILQKIFFTFHKV